MGKTSFPQELWLPLEREAKDAEKIERPSLTFLQDGWRRLRHNWIAMGSLVCIVLITLGALVIPLVWPYSYEEQNLSLANLPPFMTVAPLDSDTALYVTPQYSVVALSPEGHLKELLTPTRRDLVQKKTFYDVNGNAVVLDYGPYSKALLEFRKLQHTGKDPVLVAEVPYLRTYFAGREDRRSVTLDEARDVLEHRMDRVTLTKNGAPLDIRVRVHNKTHLLGTDGLGRDLFIRIVYGARISLTVGILAAIINFVVGVFYGGFAGYLGGRVDNVMMRLVDTVDSIPMTLYVILIMVVVGPGLLSIILALGLTFWIRMARLVRGQVLTLKQQEFVKAAVVVGANRRRIMTKHLIPNMMGPIMVNITMQIPSAIFNEAFLSFVGLGISAPMASWGTLCNDALAGIYVYPYQMVLPAIAISVTILTFNLLGDGLRDAFDPKLRR